MPMRRSLLLLSLAGLLNACNPHSGAQTTLGPPAPNALKTTELTADAASRLNILSSQTDLDNNSLFSVYRPNTTSKWNGGWTRRLDFSGVSWNRLQAGTAITPQHVVFAAHYRVARGTTLTFHERNGSVHSRKIVNIKALRGKDVAPQSHCDIAVALLDRPLPPAIKIYRLLPPRTDYPQTLAGAPVIVTEQGRRAYIHQVRAQSGNTISFTKNKNVPENLFKNLVKGDSGNPSFLLVGGEPVLIETHTSGGSGSGPFYSSPAVFKALEKVVADFGPGYKIKTVPLDPQLAPALPKRAAVKIQPQPAAGPSPPKTAPEKNQPRPPRVRRVPVPLDPS